MWVNGFGGHSCEETARSANMELLHRKSSSQNFTGQQYFSNRSFRAQPFLKVPICKESPASIKFAGDSYSNHKARNVL